MERIDKEVLEKSIFSNQYKKSLYTLDSYFALHYGKANEGIEDASNVFAFIGERGSGKTSCMMSIARLLNKEEKSDVFDKYTHLKDTRFKSLDLIEPSFFDEYNNIISLVVSQIYSLFRDKRNGIKEKSSEIEQKERRIIQCLDRVQRSLSQVLDAENNKPEDIDGLVHLAAAVNLRDDIHKLVDSTLEYLGCEGGVLLVPIDDIDLNSAQATAMIEQIRKYLVNKNIVILMALKLDQLSQLKKQQYIKDYETLIENKEIRMDAINEMTERYISKLIPTSQRIYQPDPDTYLFSPVTIVLENKEELKFPTVRQSVTELIFRKTRYLFYNSPGNTNYVVPRNLREIRQLTSMLANMNDYADEVKNGDSNNLYNKTIFKRYFFGNWTMSNLNAGDQHYVKEIMEVADALQINSSVVNILNKRFELSRSSSYSRNSYGRATLDNDSETNVEMRYLLDDSNKYYNVSLGDVLSLLEVLDKQHQNIEDRKFIFAIRAIYSILLYEYYDEVTEAVPVVRKKKVLKEVEFRRDMSSYKMSRLLQLMSGRIFNARLENNLIPKSNGRVARTDRIIDLYQLNSWISDCLANWDAEHITQIRLTELFMLCISRVAVTQSRGNNDNYYYPTFRSQMSWAYIESMESRQYGMFDLGSLFFNLQRIEDQYCRFKRGREFFEKASQIGSPSLYNEFKTLTTTRNKKNKATIYDVNRWLSWCTIRNTEVYDAIMSDLRNYEYKDSGNDVVVIRHFFEIINKFHMQTYDRNPDGNDYYEIDYSFLTPVVNLLAQKEAEPLFNDFYSSATSVNSRNRKSIMDEEGNVIYDDRVDTLMRRQFKNPPYKQNQVYRRLISPKGISEPKREILLEMTKNYDKLGEMEIRHLLQSYFAFVDGIGKDGKSSRNS